VKQELPPAQTSPVVVLRPSKKKLIWFLLVSLAFVAVGLQMISHGEFLGGWLGVLFFGSGGVVFGIQLVPGASYLRISSEGFAVCTLFRRHPIVSWKEASAFRVALVPPRRTKMVLYDRASGAPQRAARRINQFLVGADEGLPDTYGMKPQDLADFLNDWRVRATRE
jgi:hypothetical protein